MAFFTFTTVSGSAATNNLVLSVVQDVGSDVTVKLVNGIVTYFNANGDYVSTGYGVSAFAANGIALAKTSQGATGTNLITATSGSVGNIGVDLATFQTTGFVSKANKPSAGITFIDATGNTSAQIDAFIANKVGAAANSLINTTLEIDQYTLLNGSLSGSTSYLKTGSAGVIALDATGASSTEVAQVITDSNAGGASTLASGSVNNIVLSANQFDSNTATDHILYAKLAASGADINALDAAAGGTSASTANDIGRLMEVVNANASKVGDVYNVRASGGNINDANFAAFATQLTANGVISVTANTALATAAITLGGGGANFTVGDVIAFTGGTTNGVAATATVTAIGAGGTISAISTNLGTGYTSVPTGISILVKANPAATFTSGSGPNVTFGSATLGTGQITADAWNTVIANAGSFADGSIGASASVDVSQLTVAKFLQIANEFAVNSAGQTAVGLDLYGASATQINNVITNVAKLASGTVEEANVTPTQFAALASKIAAGEATVNAGSASAAEVTAILNNLSKFDNAQTTDGVAHTASYLTLNAAQINSLGAGGIAALDTATPVGSVGALNIVAVDSTTAMNLNFGVTGNVFNNVITGMGSNADDTVTFAGKATFNGAKGGDIIVGSNTASSLSGGDGADKITGGNGADTITGGKAGAAGGFNVLTGGQGNDTFNLNLNSAGFSVNVITDLGQNTLVGGVANVDYLNVAAGAVGTAYMNGINTGSASTYTGFVATTGNVVNNGTMTIKNSTYNVNNNTSVTNSQDATINLQNATGTNGFSVVGGTGNDVITGSLLGDNIDGDLGNDIITGLSGADTLTGGAGQDTFNVSGSGVDVITDLGLGYGTTTADTDILSVSVGASVAATVTNSWVATGDTTNAGTATLTLGNAVNVNLDAITSGNGFTITAAGNTAGSSITGSLAADNITGSNGSDTIAGLEGIDTIALGSDSNQDTVLLTTTNLTVDRDVITGFTAGVGGDQILGDQSSSYTAYSVARVETLATVSTIALLGAGAANSAAGSATVNYIVADTAANILSSDLSNQFKVSGSDYGVLAYATDTGNLYYDADGNFTASAVLVGNVTASGTLTADNFLIVA